MNLQGQMAIKNTRSRSASDLATPAVDASEDATVYHERELRFIAAFRLRDAANRVATLVSMSTSAPLRAELLAVYDRLMDEERELLVRSMEAAPQKASRNGGRTAGRR